MGTTSAPLQNRDTFRVVALPPIARDFCYVWQTEDSFPAMMTNTYKSLTRLKQIFAWLREDNRQIGSIEFVRGSRGVREFRGALLFDTDDKLIVHAPHALLGYYGDGPTLSREILALYGMAEGVFTYINERVIRDIEQRDAHGNPCYSVAITLQRRTVENVTILPTCVVW